MSRSFRGRTALVAVMAFLTLAALAPLAAADHAYSHRYIVFGRVVDAENNPVPGLTVDLGTQKPFNPEGPCANQLGTDTDAFGPTRTTPVTNEMGEFMFCYHHHSMSRGTPGSGILALDPLGVEKPVEFDGFMRYSFVPVKLDTVSPSANKTALDELYTVQGRAWRASDSEIKVEQVGVYGDTLHNEAFTVVVTFDGEDPQTFTGVTNNYGDFALRVPVTERPTGGTVKFTIQNVTFPGAVDPAMGTTHIRAQIGDLKTTPGAPVFAFVALAALAAFALRRRG